MTSDEKRIEILLYDKVCEFDTQRYKIQKTIADHQKELEGVEIKLEDARSEFKEYQKSLK